MGQSFRMTPIFSDLRENLESKSEEARKNSPYQRVRDLTVLPTLHSHSNPSTTAKKIVLRASTETDLMDAHGLRRACQWAGNSAATAMKNYALVRKSDFQDIGTAGKSDAKCAAIDASDAKCAAESASTTEQKPHKNSTVENGRSLPCMTVGVEGLEPPTLSV